MKKLYLMALALRVEGQKKDLKELDKLSGALVNYLRNSLPQEELEQLSRMDLEVHVKSNIKEYEDLMV